MSARLLLETYGRATPEQVARGRAWYRAMRRACTKVSRDTGTPVRRVAAVAAITSPDATLASNLRWTRVACETGGAARVGRYPNAMHARYVPVLTGEVNPLDGVGGHKVTAFYRAIMGDGEAVVLDRWALRALGHHRDTATPAQYARLAEHYRDAARVVGERPADFQAIVWIVLRDAASTRHPDIHEIGA